MLNLKIKPKKEHHNEKSIISTVIGSNYLTIRDLENYPQTTDKKCWWCFHAFKNRPIGIPKKYDSTKGVFYVFGYFCSFECTLAAISSNEFKNLNVKYETSVPLLNLMYTRSMKQRKIVHISKAPPRYALKDFGGSMSIEEFRTSSHDYDVGLLPMVPVQMFCDKKIAPNHDIRLASSDEPKTHKRISLINTF